MKILLIYPNPDHKLEPQQIKPLIWKLSKFFIIDICKFPTSHIPTIDYLLPPLSLLVVAANIPSDVEVELVDERVEKVNFDAPYDLVGISVMTSAALHSYNIAKKFMDKGVPVLLGGVHPSLLPEEAKNHSSSIVIGEVEGLWEEIIVDLKNKKLKKEYKNQTLSSLESLPIPRFDLLKKEFYLTTNLIETSRGCPFKCAFCATNKISGNRYRFRPVDDIIAEIKTRQLENKHIVFMSDNIFGNKGFSKSLFTSLIPLNVIWQGGSTIAIANHPEILHMASKSGCRSLLIGFESVSKSNMDSIEKKQTPEEFPKLIERIHQQKIGITGNFIVGLDNDHLNIFDDLIKFINKNNIECPQISILIPYPSTKIHEMLKAENRIIDFNWEHYSNISGNVVYIPKHMTISDLKMGYWKTWKKVYSTWSIFKRLISTRNFLSFYIPYNIVLKTKSRIV